MELNDKEFKHDYSEWHLNELMDKEWTEEEWAKLPEAPEIRYPAWTERDPITGEVPE